MKRKTYLWMIGLGALLIILGIVVYFATSSTRTLTIGGVATSTGSTDTTTQTDYAKDWATLSSPVYTIKYPKDFTLSDETEGRRLTVPVKSYFNTILPDEAYITIYDATVGCPAPEGANIEATTTFKVGKVSFDRNEWSDVGAGQLYRGILYTSVQNGICYAFQTYTHSANGAGFYFSSPAQIKLTDDQHAADMKAFFELSDKIVGTFNFNE